MSIPFRFLDNNRPPMKWILSIEDPSFKLLQTFFTASF